MTMADCRTCKTRITSLRDGWVHLATGMEGHDPEPPLTHAWHKKQAEKDYI